MGSPHRRVRLAALVALALVSIPLVREGVEVVLRARYAARQADHRPVLAETLALLPGELRESSGLAVSRRWPGTLWTHNDSGDGPRFYAMDLTGRLLGSWAVPEARARDWEAADLGPCPIPDEAGDCLWLADTGDNALRRDTLTVYVVPEPDPADTSAPAWSARLRYGYPDRPHDVEAIAVHPVGDLVIVTKGRTGDVLLFTLPAAVTRAAVAADSVVVLPPGRRLAIEPSWALGRAVTGAAFDPAGGTLAVRTYTEIFFFPWPLPADPAFGPASCFLGRLDPGGEAIAWEDARTLLLTSERARGRDGPLTRVRCAPGGKDS